MPDHCTEQEPVYTTGPFLYVYPSIFPCLFLTNSSQSLLFPSCGSFSKHLRIDPVQYHNTLQSIHSSVGSSSISTKDDQNSISCWLLMMGFRLGPWGWGSPGTALEQAQAWVSIRTALYLCLLWWVETRLLSYKWKKYVLLLKKSFFLIIILTFLIWFWPTITF